MSPITNLWRTTEGYRADLLDGAIAALFSVMGLLVLRGLVGSEEGYRDVDSLAVALFLMQTVPLAVRRRWPIGVFVAQLYGGLIPFASAGYATNTVGMLAILVAFFTIIERTDLRRSLAMLAVAAIGILIFYQVTRDPVEQTWRATLDVIVSFGAAFALGTFVRSRRAQGEADHAEVERLEADQQRLTTEAIAEERAGIARELHDAVGHALNLVVIQAGAAQRVIDSKPELAAEALAAIESASRRALTDMDRMLGLLREPSDGAQSSEAAPGLDRLDGLIEDTRAAGLPVDQSIEGDPVRLPQTIDLSAFRIVQEALTNALKHAGDAQAQVHVRYLDRAVELEIIDDGHGATAKNGGGRGLIGMRERVRLFGGELDAGPIPTGGYRVRARLPLEERQR